MTYAKGTDVPVDRTRNEIEATLRRYGASHFGYFSEPTKAIIAFAASDRKVRFDLPLPGEDSFARAPGGKTRSDGSRRSAHERACREKWRALLLCIKAKLESVEAGIESFEDAFMPHVVMPDGRTVGEQVRGNIALAYERGESIPLITGPGAKR